MFKIFQNSPIIENQISELDTNTNIVYTKQFIQPFFQLIVSDENKQSFLQKKKSRKLKSLSIQNNNTDNSNGRWTKEEHNRFIEAIINFGNDWKKVQKYVSTRTSTQARSHAQKFLMKLRNSEFFKKKNIDNNLSWAKTIHFIKNNFSNDELEFVLKNVHCNVNKENNKKKKKLNKNKLSKLSKLNSDSTEFNSDDSESVFSDFNNNKNFQFNDENKENDPNYLFYLDDENDNLKANNNNNDYIQTFIQNFNRKNSYINDLDFTINDINNIYYDNKINNNNIV
jgi:SHAQKYF class myb-like DNA-binding protein